MTHTDQILAALDFDFDVLDALTTGPCARCSAPLVETEISDRDRARAEELIARILEMGYTVAPICRDCQAKGRG